MNNLITSLVGSAALAASAFAGTSGKGVAPVAPAPVNDDLGASIGLGYDSNFYFRGLEWGQDWVSANLNYGTALTEAINLDLGANYGTDFGEWNYDRLVLSAALSQKLGAIDASLGYRHYSHDGSALLNDSSEIFLNLGTQVSIFNVGLASNYDATNEGWYFELGVNTEIKLCDRISLVPGANIGYGADYNYQIAGVTGVDGFTAVTLSLGAPIKLNSRATLTPYVAGRLAVDALEDAGLDNEIYGGVALTVKF